MELFASLHKNNSNTKVSCKYQPLDSLMLPLGSVVHLGEEPQHDQETIKCMYININIRLHVIQNKQLISTIFKNKKIYDAFALKMQEMLCVRWYCDLSKYILRIISIHIQQDYRSRCIDLDCVYLYCKENLAVLLWSGCFTHCLVTKCRGNSTCVNTNMSPSTLKLPHHKEKHGKTSYLLTSKNM